MRIVRQRHELDASLLEGLLGDGESIGETGYHADHLKSCLAKSGNSLERRATRRDQVLDDHDLLPRDELALDAVLHTVILWFRTNVYERHVQFVSNQSTLRDGTSSYSGYSISLRELLQDSVNELKLYIIAEFWE